MDDWVKYCETMLTSNGLRGWRAVLSRGRRTIGLCDYSRKTISLSKYHLESDDPEYIRDTVIHEVAHALTPFEGHSTVWRNKARELGGTGTQYAKHSAYPSKWITMCASGHESKLFRWNQRSIYTCKCGAIAYVVRSDRSPTSLPTSYVTEFNRLALSQGHPPIDHQGRPLL